MDKVIIALTLNDIIQAILVGLGVAAGLWVMRGLISDDDDENLDL